MTTMLDAHVRGYAQAVRLHLAHLGPDLVEDLTSGLEADLAEAVADRTPVLSDGPDDVALDLSKLFGPPARYADELRTAAGLPAPVAARRRGRLRTAVRARVSRLRQGWSSAWAPLTTSPGWHRLREALADLVPVWWVARGWVIGSWFAAAFTGRGFTLVPVETSSLVVVVVATAVSIQWGRGRWLPWAWMPRFVTVASVAAVLLALPLVDATQRSIRNGDGSDWSRGYQAAVAEGRATGSAGTPVAWDAASPSGMDGVWVDGQQVSNLFAYDADGDPLRGVQLFDDRGRAVRTVAPGQEWQPWAVPDVDGQWFFRPSLATDGRSRWNVFPLQALPETDLATDDETGEPKPAVGARPQDMPWPFLKAPTSVRQGVPTPAPSERAPEPEESESQEPESQEPEGQESEQPEPKQSEAPTPDPEDAPEKAEPGQDVQTRHEPKPTSLTSADGA
ncbi:hypothetical protein Xcel_2677 [Xylanimonas cellulosilytica DSM 15894]|uniref:Uncharacterized protein n=1 Tax=Xylanimonas cellulosilytica (strain DSM 15894 / JCM 12276 / CECT 5975 / KCTC 9989 / LMG 20990 / NBRC 107835 / XIL07) TaxID=446471 RepID=D1BXQ0_XYLCX|nr:hypothetical protein [Xylanimonas cellulosilytica]ACZ31691.1 hypothetical protein Xcel_2677 [Xylanimonas cellulosilytica DSM 15894]